MNGTFDLTTTQATTFKSLPQDSSINSKRALSPYTEFVTDDVTCKKCKKEFSCDDEHHIVPHHRTEAFKNTSPLLRSPNNQTAHSSSDEHTTASNKAPPKRKRYGNWLREVANHVCKLLKLRHLSLKCLSKALNENTGRHESSNSRNSPVQNISPLLQDIFDSPKSDGSLESASFMAFLDGFSKIKRNTYKMTDSYIRQQPLFGIRLTKEILDFIPENDQISDDSQYLKWIEASTRMTKATKSNLLDSRVRSALRRPLKELYKSMCRSNLEKNSEEHVGPTKLWQENLTDERDMLASFIKHSENINQSSNLHMIEDEGGGGGEEDRYKPPLLMDTSRPLEQSDIIQRVKAEGTEGSHQVLSRRQEQKYEGLLFKKETDLLKEEDKRDQTTSHGGSTVNSLSSFAFNFSGRENYNASNNSFDLSNRVHYTSFLPKPPDIQSITQGLLQDANVMSSLRNFIVRGSQKDQTIKFLEDLILQQMLRRDKKEENFSQ